MNMPKGYDTSKIGQSDCPDEWLEYFLDCSNDLEEKVVKIISKKGPKSNKKINLFDTTQEQIDSFNYWINL